MYFRSHLVSMKCFPPFQSYTEVLEGSENHSRGAILSYFHPILARNKSWTILNDHYTTSTVLVDVFSITCGVYEVFPTLPKLYRGVGRAWKSLTRSYFELISRITLSVFVLLAFVLLVFVLLASPNSKTDLICQSCTDHNFFFSWNTYNTC